MNPSNGEILAMASSPTYKPSIFVGRTNQKKLAPLLDPETAKADNYPGLNRVTEGLYPPGSTFKPVTALAAMQERLISPFQTIPCTPSFEVHGQVFKNWDPYVNQPMTLPEAIGASCDTYFYNLGYAFYALPPDRGHPLQGWASRFGFGGPTGIDVGPEQAGLLPTPEWRQATYTTKTDPGHWQIDRLWKPGDSIQLAIGQKDLLVTPLQMVRFYSLIANGGKLVTPHVLYAVDEPGSGRALPQPARAEVEQRRPGRARRRARRPLSRHARVVRHRDRGVRQLPDPDRRQDGHGGEGRSAARLRAAAAPGPVLVVRLRPADATETPKIAVCAVIENGGHGGTAAAPAALKVFEQFFHTQADRRPRADPLRLAMADLVYTPTERSRARARRRELTQEAPLLARLDWVMLGTVLAIVGLRALERSPASRATTSPAAPTTTSTASSCSSAIGLRRPRRRDPDRPRDLPPVREADLRRARSSCSRSCSSPGTVARGSKRWIDLGFFRFQPSEFGKLLDRPRARRLPRRPVPADRRVADVADRGRAGAAADAARVHPAGHRLRARLRRRARRRAADRRRALVAPRRLRDRRGRARAQRALVAAVGRACRC